MSPTTAPERTSSPTPRRSHPAKRPAAAAAAVAVVAAPAPAPAKRVSTYQAIRRATQANEAARLRAERIRVAFISSVSVVGVITFVAVTLVMIDYFKEMY